MSAETTIADVGAVAIPCAATLFSLRVRDYYSRLQPLTESIFLVGASDSLGPAELMLESSLRGTMFSGAKLFWKVLWAKGEGWVPVFFGGVRVCGGQGWFFEVEIVVGGPRLLWEFVLNVVQIFFAVHGCPGARVVSWTHDCCWEPRVVFG